MAHHFGGDALFCNLETGCRLLNMDGDLLWEVDQETIDSAMAAACESGVAQNIEAGQGTYGSMILEVNCYSANGSMLKLIGYDEHGKQNEMPFHPNYAPVNAPVSRDRQQSSSTSVSGDCVVDLGSFGFASYDGIHVGVGFDVWESPDEFLDNPSEDIFLKWSATRQGLPDCGPFYVT